MSWEVRLDGLSRVRASGLGGQGLGPRRRGVTSPGQQASAPPGGILVLDRLLEAQTGSYLMFPPVYP